MSLYYEGAKIVSQHDAPLGTLKSRIFGGAKALKAPPKQLYALVSQASKWSSILSEVVERAALLAHERKLSPALAVLLVHDLLLSSSGVAAPVAHPLRVAVERHRVRLQAEFTRLRIRREFASLEALREEVERSAIAREIKSEAERQWPHPRWVRVNGLKTTLEEQLIGTFAEYRRVESLKEVMQASLAAKVPKVLHVDKHVPGLIALPSSIDLSVDPAYLNGNLIFQDKASCFPALLLDLSAPDGDVLDACAAPGNKTTNLAAILHSVGANVKIHACERDRARALTLQKMVVKAGAGSRVSVHPGQDFLQVDPEKEPWCRVQSVLLDPSCSGSGIVGRDETFYFELPKLASLDMDSTPSRKRKRRGTEVPPADVSKEELDEAEPVETTHEQLSERLKALSEIQTKLLLHAFRFPQAKKIVYSTCSVYENENEAVVGAALALDLAKKEGWRVLSRSEQVASMRSWPERGRSPAFAGLANGKALAEACIRCSKNTEDGTQGFFVVGVQRDRQQPRSFGLSFSPNDDRSKDDEPWEGFTDGDP